jgi:hypothetical protein
MDSESEIENMAEVMAKDEGWSKLRALSVLQSRYESERRLEEALRTKKIIEREESKTSDAPKGFYNES